MRLHAHDWAERGGEKYQASLPSGAIAINEREKLAHTEDLAPLRLIHTIVCFAARLVF